jgi:geranylgeranyl diphosphate synthase, type I
MVHVTAEREVTELQRKYLAAVNSELRSVISPAPDGPYPLLRYHLGWEEANGTAREEGGGKALRPVLCLTAAEVAGGDWHQALAAAASLELIHNFSLIHDDIQDGDVERRHRSTVWSLWDIPRAMTAGNAMRVVADRTLAMLSNAGLPDACVVDASLVLTERYLEMIEGQYQDISFEDADGVTPEQYLEMVGRKTGALIDASMYLGALIATQDAAQAASFGRSGRRLGLAFQIRDDILGIWGDPAETGKAIGADIRRRKKSLPVVYLLQKAKGRDKKWLQGLYDADHEMTDTDVEGVLEVMERVGAMEYCQQMAEDQSRQGEAATKGLPLTSAARDTLHALGEYFVTREK